MATGLNTARKTLNTMLGVTGFQLVRPGERAHVKSYQPFKRTLDGARKARLSVGDYIDSKFHVPGATQATIEQLAQFGVFEDVHRICEIGPGSGRYLERIQRLCAPCSYEIYEPEKEWSDWLARKYNVTTHDSDGKCLQNTATGSVDLVHAHKVFVCLPFVVTCQYFDEMVRVTRPGGKILFDIVSEDCMPEEVLEKWISSAVYYPCMLPRQFVVDFFARRKCSLRWSFFATMMPGKSEYLVFVKQEHE